MPCEMHCDGPVRAVMPRGKPCGENSHGLQHAPLGLSCPVVSPVASVVRAIMALGGHWERGTGGAQEGCVAGPVACTVKAVMAWCQALSPFW